MTHPTYVDQILVHWGEEILWDERGPVRKGKAQGPIKVLMGAAATNGFGAGTNGHARAQKIRAHLVSLVNKPPQVMVKITGGGPDMKRIGSHIDYIARGGRYKKKGFEELEIETEDGQRLQGKEDRELIKEWFKQGGAPIPEEIQDHSFETKINKRQKREALNMILSMPHGINREQVKAAARATVHELFEGRHLYAMVHHEDTDHQHTHVVVKMVGHDGSRLNPRKADLENWRLTFAKHLNARGVQAVATRRRVRLQREKGQSQAVRQMKDRGIKPKREITAQTQVVAKHQALSNDKRFAKAYAEMAHALSNSQLPQDQALGKDVQTFLNEQGMSDLTKRPIKKIGIR